MSAAVRISSKLPGDEEINGLDAMLEELIAHPNTLRAAVVIFDVQKVTKDTDTGDTSVTARWRAVEPIGDVSDAPPEVRKLIDTAREKRLGRKALPFEEVEVVKADEIPADDEGM